MPLNYKGTILAMPLAAYLSATMPHEPLPITIDARQPTRPRVTVCTPLFAQAPTQVA